MQELLSYDEVERGLRRIAEELLAQQPDTSDLVLIGVRRGGLPMMERLAGWIKNLNGADVATGSVDITLYRDDAASALPNPRIGASDIPVHLDGKRVVLIDDVLYTRRTIRAAIDALMDYGRPRNIELAVMVDRAGRQLPIQPDYRIRRVESVADDERIDVYEDERGLRAVISKVSSPSIPPRAAPDASDP